MQHWNWWACDGINQCWQYRWKASWQLTDAFETWRAGARYKHDMRIKTASAFEYLYLSLGQRTLRAWQEAVVYTQKVLSVCLVCPSACLPVLATALCSEHVGLSLLRPCLDMSIVYICDTSCLFSENCHWHPETGHGLQNVGVTRTCKNGVKCHARDRMSMCVHGTVPKLVKDAWMCVFVVSRFQICCGTTWDVMQTYILDSASKIHVSDGA